MRWEYVVRGVPKGTREEQELVRRAATGKPQHSIDIEASSKGGLQYLQFDNLPPNEFAPQTLMDGNYRAALEIFSGNILVGQVDLYKFVIDKVGSTLTRDAPRDPPLVVIKAER